MRAWAIVDKKTKRIIQKSKNLPFIAMTKTKKEANIVLEFNKGKDWAVVKVEIIKA